MITPPLFSKLYNLEKQEPRSIDFDLEAFRSFADSMGAPQREMGKIIHIAGTNGKGSVSEILSQLLTACGYRTGLFTSPHIREVNERVKFNNEKISDVEFLKWEEMVYERINGKLKSYRTFFEAITMLAFLYFRSKETDFAIIETGMGGRLDSTNIVDSDAAVITIVDYDHMHILGNTLQDIAAEKAGIIKPGKPVFTFLQNKTVNSVIQKRADKLNADMHIVNTAEIINDENGFEYDGSYYNTTMPAMYQRSNSALSISVLRHFNIDNECIKSAMPNVAVPGRFEQIHDEPVIILDGSHNPSAIETALRESRKRFPGRYLCTISVFMQDKDIRKNTDILKAYADRVMISSFDFFRSAKKEHYRDIDGIDYHDSLEHAFMDFHKSTKKKMLLITGSFYILSTMRDIAGRYYH